MVYRVTTRNRPALVGPSSGLNSALEEACARIRAGEVAVTIHDGIRNRISGDDLAACCRGEKRLTIDLKTT
jgi:hypothetical protein